MIALLTLAGCARLQPSVQAKTNKQLGPSQEEQSFYKNRGYRVIAEPKTPALNQPLPLV